MVHAGTGFRGQPGLRPPCPAGGGPCTARAVVIDVREKAAKHPDYTLSVADVTAFEAKHGKIRPGSAVLLRTGWSKRWPDERRYLGDDTPGDASNLHFPSYRLEAAKFLIRKRQVSMIGVDTASIDPGTSQDFPVHRLAAANAVVASSRVPRRLP